MCKTTPMTPVSRPCFTAFLALVLCLPLWLAKPSHAIEVVPQTADFYVNDAASLLSPGTKKYIIDTNDKLYKACGAQVVVVTVPDLGGAALEEYATTLF
ncbi:MAG: TPM domain-containing protein, partial [Acidaminococcaceae bacterium]|nr:TPM domain-containing protein [Acidaminococcaceae bacterium]